MIGTGRGRGSGGVGEGVIGSAVYNGVALGDRAVLGAGMGVHRNQQTIEVHQKWTAGVLRGSAGGEQTSLDPVV